MAKMTKSQKAWRKTLLARLEKAGGKVLFNPDSGVTVATMPSIAGGRAKFGRVAIAMCSDNDKPKRKMGERLAMESLFDGISFPVKIENWVGNWQDTAQAIFSSQDYL